MSDTAAGGTPERVVRHAVFGDLYDLLVVRFPQHRAPRGGFDVPRLAGQIEVSKEAVYKALRADRLSPKMMSRFVALHAELRMAGETGDAEALTAVDLIPFLTR